MPNTSTTPGEPNGSYRVTDGERRRRGWVLPLLLALIAVAVLLLLLSRCGGDPSSPTSTSTPSTAASSSAASAPSTSTEPATTTATSSTSSATDSTTSPSATSGAQAVAGTVVSGGDVLLGGDGVGDLTGHASKRATGRSVLVQAVPADEGFWVGTSEQDRVWVQLNGSGESSYQVKRGDRVDFTGLVTSHGTHFATTAGVGGSEGADQLNEQRAHIAVAKGDVTLSK